MTALFHAASDRAPGALARLQHTVDGLGAAAKRLFLDRQLDFWLGELDPSWSLTERRARVVEIIDETRDMKTFVLAVQPGWPGHRAGQYVPVDVEVDGVRERRCYSITSAPDDARLAITVKRAPGGRVSNHLHDRVRVGSVVVLGDPLGDFVVDDPSEKLALVSGGSGITPMIAIVRDLAARGVLRDVVFVHCARSQSDVAFLEELGDLAERHAGLRVIMRLDDAGEAPGPLSTGELLRLVPDLAARQTWLCGPAGMMDALAPAWSAPDAAPRLHVERFVSRAPVTTTPGDGRPVRLTLAKQGRDVTAGAGTLLDELLASGERPAFGCRIGICHTCKCKKRRGAVVNLLTGAVSTDPDEEIQLCISAARSDLELDL